MNHTPYRLDLLRVMDRLREPRHGLPWDIRQDFRNHGAVNPGRITNSPRQSRTRTSRMAEELGDALFSRFYARLWQRAGPVFILQPL